MSLGVEHMCFYVFVGAPQGPIPAGPHQGPGPRRARSPQGPTRAQGPAGPDPRRAPPGPRGGPRRARSQQGPTRAQGPAGPDPRRAPPGPRGGRRTQGPGPDARAKRALDSSIYISMDKVWGTRVASWDVSWATACIFVTLKAK